jgi:predicted enzyme related to lactoylglutathione lyase
MAHIDSHPTGSFCWIELATPDQSASKKFYGPLFGWGSADHPMGPNEVYTLFQLEGRDTGGCYRITEEMKGQGVPPHWMIYVQTENADATTAKAKDAGATVMMGPLDVFTMGRMSVIKDPTGAVFSIWQPGTNKGTGIEHVPGTICWADLSTPDQEKGAEFYRKVFGWEIAPGEHDSSGYLHIKNGEHFIGGVPAAAQRDPNSPPHWLIYFLVDDCDASTAKAKELGAHIYMAPMTLENVGRFSVIADPQGAVSSLFQPARKG